MRQKGILLAFLLCPFCTLTVHSEEDSRILRAAIYEEAPYQFYDEQGRETGLLIEIFNEVAARTGYEPQYIATQKISDCVQILLNGEADLILGMPSYNNYNLIESVELYSSPMALIGSAGIGENIGYEDAGNREDLFSVGYDFHTISDNVLYRVNSQRHVISSSQNALLNYQQNGKVDVVIADLLIAKWFFRDPEKQKHEILSDFLDNVRYTIAVREDERSLLRELNTGILEYRLSGNYSKLVEKWSITDLDELVVKAMRRALAVLLAVLAAVVGYTLIRNKLYKMMEREVEVKTTALQQAKDELETRYQQLNFNNILRRQIIENSTNGLVLVDRNYRVQLMNSRAAQLANVKADEKELQLTSMHCFREFLQQLGQDIFGKRQEFEQLTFSIETDDLQKQIYRGNVNQIIQNDQIISALFSLEDVTLEIETTKKTFESEKNAILNRIVAGIAHEIKNPLMSIRIYASLIDQKMDDPEFRASFAEFVPRESERINQLVESLVNYAKPIQGQQVITDLFELVRECAYLSGVARKTKGISFCVEAEGHCFIRAVPVQIKQVLINIIINSIESLEKKLSMDPQAEDLLQLKIRTFVDGREGYVEIRDEGVGMSKEVREHCMELFYTTKEKGSGLGLALSAQYLKENEGKMKITSEEGKYCCFLLSFRRIVNEGENINCR